MPRRVCRLNTAVHAGDLFNYLWRELNVWTHVTGVNLCAAEGMLIFVISGCWSDWCLVFGVWSCSGDLRAVGLCGCALSVGGGVAVRWVSAGVRLSWCCCVLWVRADVWVVKGFRGRNGVSGRVNTCWACQYVLDIIYWAYKYYLILIYWAYKYYLILNYWAFKYDLVLIYWAYKY